MEKIKVAIADDHQLVADGLVSILRESEEIEVVGIANDGVELLKLLQKETVHVAIVDVEMPKLTGIEVTRLIQEKAISTRVLGLSMYNESSIIMEMTMAGAKGYILKNVHKDELLTAIKKIAGGGLYFSKEVLSITDRPLKGYFTQEEVTGVDKLTKREIEVLICLSEGLSTQEISEKLCISPRTVDTHRTNMMKKLQVNSISKLVRVAYRSGISA